MARRHSDQRLASLVLSVGLVLSGCSSKDAVGRSPADERAPDVVLISIDTLRSDRLPAYGYDAIETPAIDALRAAGVLFERAYSPFPLTLPAHSTMLTGLLPPGHGVRDNNGYRLAADALPFLPRLLRERGYRTGAAVSSWVLRRDTGMAEGFDFYDDEIERSFETEASGQRLGPATLEAVLPWLRQESREPFFLFFHLYEPHGPFSPPEPYASRYESPYDGEVAAADAVVGDLVAELESLGVFDRALIVLTSDHGEGLRDHVEEKHGIFIYREALQVPLIIKLPGNQRAGETVSDPAHLADIVPTVLSALGFEVPATTAGLSLLEPTGPERALYSETYHPRIYFGWSHLRSIVQGRYHYIESPEPELFDLVADPAETVNLVAEERPRATRLRRELTRIPDNFEGPGESDEETRLQLASLGYIGLLRGESSLDMPSPRSQAELLPLLETAMVAAELDRHQEAIEGFRSVLAANPRMLMVWPMLARSLQETGRPAEALEAFERSLAASEDSPRLALSAARIAFRLGDTVKAERYAELAAPAFPVAHRMIAQLALVRGDLVKADSAVSAALEESPADPSALMLLAQVRLAQGSLDAALEATDRAEAQAKSRTSQPTFQGLDLVRGNILARAGRHEEAIAAYEAEIASYPTDPRAYVRQVFLSAERGDAEAIVPMLRRMIEGNGAADGWIAAVRALRTLGDDATAGTLLAEGRRRFPDSDALRSEG